MVRKKIKILLMSVTLGATGVFFPESVFASVVSSVGADSGFPEFARKNASRISDKVKGALRLSDKGILMGEGQAYTEFFVAPDGNCAQGSLGLSWADAREELLDHAGDEQVRRIAHAEIVDLYRDLPQEVYNVGGAEGLTVKGIWDFFEVELARGGLSQAERDQYNGMRDDFIANQLSPWAQRQDVYEAYVNNVLIDGHWMDIFDEAHLVGGVARTYFLDALAYTQGKNLTVWANVLGGVRLEDRPAPGAPQGALEVCHRVVFDPAWGTAHMVHRNLNHFNRLEPFYTPAQLNAMGPAQATRVRNALKEAQDNEDFDLVPYSSSRPLGELAQWHLLNGYKNTSNYVTKELGRELTINTHNQRADFNEARDEIRHIANQEAHAGRAYLNPEFFFNDPYLDTYNFSITKDPLYQAPFPEGQWGAFVDTLVGRMNHAINAAPPSVLKDTARALRDGDPGVARDVLGRARAYGADTARQENLRRRIKRALDLHLQRAAAAKQPPETAYLEFFHLLNKQEGRCIDGVGRGIGDFERTVLGSGANDLGSQISFQLARDRLDFIGQHGQLGGGFEEPLYIPQKIQNRLALPFSLPVGVQELAYGWHYATEDIFSPREVARRYLQGGLVDHNWRQVDFEARTPARLAQILYDASLRGERYSDLLAIKPDARSVAQQNEILDCLDRGWLRKEEIQDFVAGDGDLLQERTKLGERFEGDLESVHFNMNPGENFYKLSFFEYLLKKLGYVIDPAAPVDSLWIPDEHERRVYLAQKEKESKIVFAEPMRAPASVLPKSVIGAPASRAEQIQAEIAATPNIRPNFAKLSALRAELTGLGAAPGPVSAGPSLPRPSAPLPSPAPVVSRLSVSAGPVLLRTAEQIQAEIAATPSTRPNLAKLSALRTELARLGAVPVPIVSRPPVSAGPVLLRTAEQIQAEIATTANIRPNFAKLGALRTELAAVLARS